jgi:hypothetical protein
MNERIKELANQMFSMEQFEYAEEFLNDEFMEQFAKLVVKECADICDKIYFDNYPDAEDFERSEEGEAIKKHFGVEE